MLSYSNVAKIISNTWINRLTLLSEKIQLHFIAFFIFQIGNIAEEKIFKDSILQILFISRHTIEAVVVNWWNVHGNNLHFFSYTI